MHLVSHVGPGEARVTNHTGHEEIIAFDVYVRRGSICEILGGRWSSGWLARRGRMGRRDRWRDRHREERKRKERGIGRERRGRVGGRDRGKGRERQR